MMEEVFDESKLVVYLCGMESWKHSRNISKLNGQKSFKNVVWIYWMKSRCLYICTVTFFFTIYSGISCLIICFNTRDNVLEGVLAYSIHCG